MIKVWFIEKDPYRIGTTRGDKLFMEGLGSAFPQHKGSNVDVSDDSSPESESDGGGVGKVVVSLKRKRRD